MAKRVVQVAKIPQKQGHKNPLRLLATLIYFYPQYKLREARKLPYKHVVLLLQEAQKQEAIKYFNATQIAAAPHSKKGEGVKTLSRQFKKIIDG